MTEALDSPDETPGRGQPRHGRRGLRGPDERRATHTNGHELLLITSAGTSIPQTLAKHYAVYDQFFDVPL